MAESLHPNQHIEAMEAATEALQERLRSGEADTYLVEDFNTFERSVFMAGQQSAVGLTEGLSSLAGYASQGHQVCVDKGYGEGETFFVSKSETYRNMMEALATKPASEPKPTDTDKKDMSGAKKRI